MPIYKASRATDLSAKSHAFRPALCASTSSNPRAVSSLTIAIMFQPLALVAAGLTLVPSALGASLLVSHYTGKLFTLEFTQNGNAGTLAVTSETTGCGSTPGWLELYPEDKKLWCFDESWSGRGYIVSFDVASNGRLTQSSQFQTSGNDVHGLLYGGSNGKSFIATAQ